MLVRPVKLKGGEMSMSEVPAGLFRKMSIKQIQTFDNVTKRTLV